MINLRWKTKFCNFYLSVTSAIRYWNSKS